MRRKLVLAGLAVLVLAIAAAGVVVYRRRAEDAARAKAQSEKAKAAAAVQAGDIVLSGLIGAREVTSVPAPIEGKVKMFHAEVGDAVYEGQLLAEIDNPGLVASNEHATLEVEKTQSRISNLEASIAAARLEVSRAQADAIRVKSEFDRASRLYSRQKLLLAEGATPRRDFEKAEKEFKSLQEEAANLTEVAQGAEERLISLNRELDSARKMLESKLEEMENSKARVEAGQVVSPVTGVVVGRKGEAGGDVNPATEDFFQIATDTAKLIVTLEPPPGELSRIKLGQGAGVYLADVPNEVLAGAVISVENGKVTVEFANPSDLVKPGQTAQVRIKVT